MYDSISKTTQETFQDLGLKVSTESNTSTNTTSNVNTESSTTATGLFQDLGGLLTALGLSFLIPFISPICIICGVILVVIFLMYVFGSNSNSGYQTNKNSQYNSDTYYDENNLLSSTDNF